MTSLVRGNMINVYFRLKNLDFSMPPMRKRTSLNLYVAILEMGELKVKMALRGFRDRDYLRTEEGFFFCVVGSMHPRDRVISYLKYVPEESGKWGRGKERFKRALPNYTIPDLMKTFKFLEKHPNYLYDSPVMNIKMSAVPLNKIESHLKPEEKIRSLMKRVNLDPLQHKVVDLVSLLSEQSGVPTEYFGVTGSVLLDIHQDFSDIDLIVYGVENSVLVKKAFKWMYEEPDSSVHRFDKRMTREWCLNKTRMYPLTYREAAEIFRRKWSRGLFRGTMFSVHPVKLEEEVTERYGDRIYLPEGMIEIEAKVSDASEADFLPSVYMVKEVKITDGRVVEDIREVASYEGLYGGLAEEDERILVKGKLERVYDKRDNSEYHRVLVGSEEAKGRDYIKLL